MCDQIKRYSMVRIVFKQALHGKMAHGNKKQNDIFSSNHKKMLNPSAINNEYVAQTGLFSGER